MLPFRLKISVEGLQHIDAQTVLNQFVCSARAKYELGISDDSDSDSLPGRQAVTHAETIITVPFAERENVRIDYNIFAALFESDHPEESCVYFKMESA